MSSRINNNRPLTTQSPKQDSTSAAPTGQSTVRNEVKTQAPPQKDGFGGAAAKSGPAITAPPGEHVASPRHEVHGEDGHIDNDGFVIPNKDGKVAGSGTPANTPKVNVKYFGGGVLKDPVVTNMYIGDYFKSTQGKKDVAHNNAFMKDLVGNKGFTSIMHQYGVDTGSEKASHVLAGKYNSKSVITQKQIETMLQKAIANGTVKPGAQSLYNFVLPPGATLKMDDGSTSKEGLGGFHSSIHTPDGKEVYYSAIAYSKGNNGIDFTNGNAQDNISITESHEYAEAATDPHVQDAIDHNDESKLGWMDMNNGEIGDIEVNDAPPGTPLSTMYSRMDGYAVQKIWSQVDHTNEIKAKHPGPVQPPKAKGPESDNNS